MIGIELRLILLMQSGDRIGNKIHIHYVDLVLRTERKRGQAGEKNERLDHIELRGLGATAVTQNDAGPEYRFWRVRQQDPGHVFTELLGSCVGIVIGAIPFDSMILGYDFVLPLSGYSHRTHFAEAP